MHPQPVLAVGFGLWAASFQVGLLPSGLEAPLSFQLRCLPGAKRSMKGQCSSFLAGCLSTKVQLTGCACVKMCMLSQILVRFRADWCMQCRDVAWQAHMKSCRLASAYETRFIQGSRAMTKIFSACMRVCKHKSHCIAHSGHLDDIDAEAFCMGLLSPATWNDLPQVSMLATGLHGC